ncbi:hypothetical protein Avbf_04092 [Armadillidium vulgare]|nr:hypothetical protein Avbf_04092 [Armadillidium vulgare]
MINFESRRPLRVTKQLYGSSLTITNVSRSDAGMYRCDPHLAVSDNVTLHVLAGENSAAMQKGKEKDEGQHYAQTSSSSFIVILF